MDEIPAALLKRIRARLPRAMLCDRTAAVRRLGVLRQKSGGREPGPGLLREFAALDARLAESERMRSRRARNVPHLSYPGELPITGRKNEIVRAIRAHRAVVISGETGCGKSTQIPKMCLEAGRGIAGRVACTQPRRIAAVTIAHRIAEELGEDIGRSVGYKIRFQERTSPEGYIKVVTDGLLLAEAQGDRRLEEYDTLIIDEAHERSLNIDFLLGLTRLLLEERPELKLIVTSATLDTEKFSRAFGDAPVIEVSGRVYPVEVEYRAPSGPEAAEEDYVDQAVAAVTELKRGQPPGDVLVFMPTEQDILETVQRLEGRKYPGVTVLPLFSRLPAGQQGRVYSVTGPKIVVATNVAETSLTIPGIKYVVDTGLARISQYQPGSHINALPVRPISRASADQRKGRCGRVQAGFCVRLYSEEDYAARPEFTSPEILRSDLAAVVLRMLDLRLGDPLAFPFIDRPTARAVKAGYETLFEVGAILKDESEGWRLTDRGRTMARMPLDPRLSRMLLEASGLGCARELAVVAAALSIRDPRERPPDKAAQADQAHARFRHPDSDFLGLLALWDRYYGDLPSTTSQSQRRVFCRDNFLSFARLREWRLLHDEILAVLDSERLNVGRRHPSDISPALYASIHRAVLTGFLANIATLKEKNIYHAAKGREVMIFPGSTLFGKSPAWLVAAEVVQTSRLYARTAARIDPGVLEELGGALSKRTYAEPAWDRARGEVVAKERVTLFGLEIVRDRRVGYARVNPEEAHAIFVRSALIEGDVDRPPAFLKHNLDVQRKVAAMEEKLRRRDIMVPEDAVAARYSERLPGVSDLRTLEKLVREHGDAFLRLSEADLLAKPPDPAVLEGFPDRVEIGGREFSAEYRFAPTKEEDGVTLRVPLGLVASIPKERLTWGVPGQLRARIESLIRNLPKSYRKLLVPAPEAAALIAVDMEGRQETDEGSLPDAVADFVKMRFRADIPAAVWSAADVPNFLKARVAVTDASGKVVAAGRDIEVLKAKVGAVDAAPEKTSSPAWRRAREKWERDGLTSWDFGEIPECVPVASGLNAYPALAPGSKGADLRLFPTREEAVAAHRAGVAALLRSAHGKDLEFAGRYHHLPAEVEKAALFFGGRGAVEKAIEAKLAEDVFARDIRTPEEFKAYELKVGRALMERGHALTRATIAVLETYAKLMRALGPAVPEAGRSSAAPEAPAAKPARKGRALPWDALGVAVERVKSGLPGRIPTPYLEAIRADLQALVSRDFLTSHPLDRLVRLPEYLEAMRIRLERARLSPDKDRAKSDRLGPFVRSYERLKTEAAASPSNPKARREAAAALDDLRWLFEEFKISLFAPEVKTAHPVSSVRLAARIKEIEALLRGGSASKGKS
jgi:ATP-dependent helicase HrpA